MSKTREHQHETSKTKEKMSTCACVCVCVCVRACLREGDERSEVIANKETMYHDAAMPDGRRDQRRLHSRAPALA